MVSHATETHPKGFIGLQVHGTQGERQLVLRWRKIRIAPLDLGPSGVQKKGYTPEYAAF